MENAPLRCSQSSLDVGEPIFATALEKVDLWLLVELDAQWAPRWYDSPGLPAATRAWMEAFIADNPGTRPQLIRRRDRACDRPRTCFLVRSSETGAASWRFEADSLEALAKRDLQAVLADPDAYEAARWRRPLFLVCTHGKRDACCARFGRPVDRALCSARGEEVWQSSHLGGHRFAATFVCLPHGHFFGRVDGPVARRVADGYAAGRLTDLLHYRGRATYARPVQAAEYFLRQLLGVYGIDALRYTRGEIAGAQQWRVRFREQASGDVHELTVNRVRTGDVASPSCGEAPAAVTRFELESHRQLSEAEDR